MSRDASVILVWGNGETQFRLRWGEIAKIQEACDAGPYVIFHRLLSNTWKLNDIKEVIRWGLIGGGAIPADAAKLVKDFVEERPPLENVIYAQAILSAGLMGAPEEDSGKPEAANQTVTD